MLYTRHMTQGILKAPVEKTCPECGDLFSTTSPVQNKCSAKCREAYKGRRKRERRSQARKDARPWITCEICSAKFQHQDSRTKYCTSTCRQTALNERSRRPRVWVCAYCVECDQSFIVSRGAAHDVIGLYCSIKCRNRAYAIKVSTAETVRQCLECGTTIQHTHSKGRPRLLCSRQCYKKRNRRMKVKSADEKKLNNHRRRARHYEVSYEPIKLATVADRNGWICGICSEPVDPALAWPDGQSKSLDHIIPLSKGGGHVKSNVQLAHLECNTRKSNSMPCPQ